MTAIDTARLHLRPFTLDDIPAYAAIRGNPAVMHFFPPTGETPAQAATRLVEHFIGHWRDPGYGPWAAVEKSSGRFLGHLGLRFLPEFGETEILYMLDNAVWGRGYATEGALAARDFAFDVLGLGRVMAIARPENRASTRVMEKIGMAYERMADFRGHALAYYAMERPAR
ncbi:MAG: GNAT family N-acetyltransferase [Alphaproteobacteria bacterium]|nr:GNAT family N-acetyltransferase [Alphaproteobacteria bacterium]